MTRVRLTSLELEIVADICKFAALLQHSCHTVAERFTSSVGSFLSAGGGESFNELTTVCFFKKPAMPKQKDELKINCYTLSEVC